MRGESYDCDLYLKPYLLQASNVKAEAKASALTEKALKLLSTQA